MDFIYSRKKVRIPKIDKNKKRKLKKLIKIAIILVIAIFVVYYIESSVEPIFDNVCSSEAKAIATVISNEETSNVMKNYNYNDLVIISTNSENNITGIQLNMTNLNKIISDVSINIQKRLEENESEGLEIAIGTFTGNRLLINRGPNIKFELMSVGNVETNYKSEFKEAGINQTEHIIYLEISCTVVMLTPFNTHEEIIKDQIILAENVIVGNIPETYYNINGIEETPENMSQYLQ